MVFCVPAGLDAKVRLCFPHYWWVIAPHCHLLGGLAGGPASEGRVRALHLGCRQHLAPSRGREGLEIVLLTALGLCVYTCLSGGVGGRLCLVKQ